MSRRPYELILAFAAVAAITAVYVPLAIHGAPRASGLAGHGMGILGFVLMLATETLYSLRKHARGRAWGRMSIWLQAHIFMGIVGPYLVLLHSAWQFSGLAGVVMLLTVIVVASGFVGRYIYTAVPRTADGAEIAIQELQAQIDVANDRLQAGAAHRPAVMGQLTAQAAAFSRQPSSDWTMILGRALTSWSYDRQLNRELRRLDGVGRAHAGQIRQLLNERYRLQRQVRSLATARRLLALWHTVHIPLGTAMFALAFIHIGAALYYVTLH